MARVREYQPLFWGDFRILSQRPISAFFVSDEHEPELTGKHPTEGGEIAALFCPTERKIVIWAGEPRREYPALLFHELTHAALDGLGVVPYRTEERVVTALTQPLSDIVLRMGWTLPQYPEGLHSLAVHARHVRYGKRQRARLTLGGI